MFATFSEKLSHNLALNREWRLLQTKNLFDPNCMLNYDSAMSNGTN